MVHSEIEKMYKILASYWLLFVVITCYLLFIYRVAIVCDEYGGLYVCVFEREDER